MRTEIATPPSKIRQVIAVQFYGRSGSMLVQSLFDGHPQMLSMPLIHARPLYEVWENLPVGLTPGNIAKETCNHPALRKYFWATLDPNVKNLGPKKNENIEVDKCLFGSLLEKYLTQHYTPSQSRADFILSIFLAYNHACGRTYETLSELSLVFPIHGLPQKIATYLVEDFKKVKFLHTIREPVQNMGCFIRHWHLVHTQQDPLPMDSYLGACLDYMVCGHHPRMNVCHYGHTPYFPDSSDVQSRAVRLEDIHLDTKTTLIKLCKWLEIAWDDCLLKGTFMGKMWHNTTGADLPSGFSTAAVQQKHNAIFSDFDRWRLAAFTYREAMAFKYKHPAPPERLLAYLLAALPFRCELHDTMRWRAQLQVLRQHPTEFSQYILAKGASILRAFPLNFERHKWLAIPEKIFVRGLLFGCILIRRTLNFIRTRLTMAGIVFRPSKFTYVELI